MLHRRWCNYHLSPEFSLHFPTDTRVGVRGWFRRGYISRLLGHPSQGDLREATQLPAHPKPVVSNRRARLHVESQQVQTESRAQEKCSCLGWGRRCSYTYIYAHIHIQRDPKGTPAWHWGQGICGEVSPGRRSVWDAPAP